MLTGRQSMRFDSGPRCGSTFRDLRSRRLLPQSLTYDHRDGVCAGNRIVGKVHRNGSAHNKDAILLRKNPYHMADSRAHHRLVDGGKLAPFEQLQAIHALEFAVNTTDGGSARQNGNVDVE